MGRCSIASVIVFANTPVELFAKLFGTLLDCLPPFLSVAVNRYAQSCPPTLNVFAGGQCREILVVGANDFVSQFTEKLQAHRLLHALIIRASVGADLVGWEPGTWKI